MEARAHRWRHDIERMDPYKDRCEDAIDARVLYAPTSRCSGLRYLVKADEFFPLTSPLPGNRSFEIVIILYLFSEIRFQSFVFFLCVFFFQVWTGKMPEQKQEWKDRDVPAKYTVVKVLSREFSDENLLTAVRVQCVHEYDGALIALDNRLESGVYIKGKYDDSNSRPQDFLVQCNSLRKLHNYNMGEPSNQPTANDMILLDQRETTNSDGDFASMRLYYGPPPAAEYARLGAAGLPPANKKKKLEKRATTSPSLVPECASLRAQTWVENELVIFRHPDNNKEVLGFVGGTVKDPYYRDTNLEKKDEHIVVFVLQYLNDKDKDKDLSWARSVVFEPKVLAAASLLKVSYE